MERGLNRGFTLIELLVVIAIIAILAAILFPVFIAAKESGKRAYCQHNLKQLASATLRYTDDYNGTLPAWPIHTNWSPTILKRYLATAKYDTGILHCPCNQAYFYNTWACGELSNTPGMLGNEGYDFYADLKYIKAQTGRKYSTIAMPSRMPMMWDGVYQNRTTGEVIIRGYGWDVKDAFMPGRMTNRHNDGSNYGFLDGHVKWYRAAGKPIYIQYVGLDFDGDGRVGTPDKIR